MINRFERFSFALSDIYRSWHRIASSEMEKYGLKGAYVLYLVTMNRYSDGITATQLGEICIKDKADVSRAITSMVEIGLVQKEGSSYRARLKLTKEGKEAAQKVCNSACAAVEGAGIGVSEEERANFYRTLEQIAINLRNVSSNGIPDTVE